jgi:hypothetical protein
MKEYLNLSKEWLPLGLATVYVLGFVIVGLHLAGYGVSSLDLFRTQYLAAGFWFFGWLFLFLGPLELIRFAEHRFFRNPRTHRAEWWFRSIGMNFVYVFTVVVFSYVAHLLPIPVVKIEEAINILWQELASSARFIAAMAFVDISFRFWVWFEQRGKDREGSKDPQRWGLATAILFTIGAFGGCITSFSHTAYRTIPYSMGGGEPREVIFWLGSGSGPADSFLERDGTTGYTIPYELLVENEGSLVVISPKEKQKAIEFDRKAVGAVVVLGTRPRTAPAHFSREATESTEKP